MPVEERTYSRWGVDTVGVEWEKVESVEHVPCERLGSDRAYGIELEFDNCPHYPNLKGKTSFGCKYDGSVRGCEFVSPVLTGKHGFKEVDYLCDFANNNGWDTGVNSGFHAHFDLNSYDPSELFKLALSYHLTKSFWRGTVPNRRRSSGYCSAHHYAKNHIFGVKKVFRDFRKFAEQFDRYAWINFHSYYKYGTVELRLHEGTMDSSDIKSWVVAHVRFIDAVMDLSIAKINRVFGNQDIRALWREIRTIVKDPLTVSYLHSRYDRNNPIGMSLSA